ncbi:MAG: 5'-3' exonuclease H3TH domain-containing protein [Polyangiaceae bacterium]
MARSSKPSGATALLFDTYSLVFRAYHALPPMSSSKGDPTSALYGFSVLLLKLLKEQRPRVLAFALDAPRRTFRHEAFAEYKGTREPTPTPLGEQLRRLPELLSALGVPAQCAPGFEADDVLATLAKGLGAQGESVLIVSGDRDLLQLVDEHCRVHFVGARGQQATLFDRDKVRERFGVEPAQLPSWAALVGDNSDNLSGVPGVGPQTATKLLQAFGDVPALLARLEEVQPERVQRALRDNAERLAQNYQLSVLRRDVELPDGPLAAPLTTSSFERLRAVFEQLEFKSLLARLDALQG